MTTHAHGRGHPSSTNNDSPYNDDTTTSGIAAAADVKPQSLPLRNAVRPDGQSPEAAVQSPTSSVADFSPSGGGGGNGCWSTPKNRIHPDSTALSCSTLSDIGTHDDLEYDDYVPQLPGSYFNMDPLAYTLTWSKPPPAAAGRGSQQAAGTAAPTRTGGQLHRGAAVSLSGSEASLGGGGPPSTRSGGIELN